MRKRIGGRKRRHGRIFGFGTIVFDMNYGTALSFLNPSVGRPLRFVRPHGSILPLYGEEIRTDPPLLHVRGWKSYDASGQSLRKDDGKSFISYRTRLQLRGIRLRRRIRLF